MVSPWVTHVKEFASRNNMSYGCAMTDTACKKEYHGKKADKIKKDYYDSLKAKKIEDEPMSVEPKVKFKPKTKKQKPIKTITKIKKEGRLEMPEVLQKVIQDFARPKAQPKVVGVFTTNYDDYYAIMDDGSILSLLKSSKKPIPFRKEKSVEDAWKWLKKNIGRLEYYNYTYNMLTGENDPFIKKYGLKIGDPSTETKMLFIVEFAGETIGRRIAEKKYETLESIERQRIEDERMDREMRENVRRDQEEKDRIQRERWMKQEMEEEAQEKAEKARLKAEKAKAKAEAKAKDSKEEKKERETFKKKVRFKDDWIYVFGEDKKADKKFIEQFERNNSPFTVIQLDYDFYLQKKPVKGKVFEDESGDMIYTIEVDNYAYDDIEGITIEFDGEEEGDEFKQMEFDFSNEHNTKLDLLAKENFKKTSKNFKDRKAKEKSAKEKSKEKIAEKSKSAEEKPKEKPKQKTAKEKAEIERIEKQLDLMNRARDRGVFIDEDIRGELIETLRGLKGSGLPQSKFDWFR